MKKNWKSEALSYDDRCGVSHKIFTINKVRKLSGFSQKSDSFFVTSAAVFHIKINS